MSPFINPQPIWDLSGIPAWSSIILAYVPVTSTAIFRWIADKMWILTNVIGYLLLLIQTTLHNLFLNFLPIMNLSCHFPELFDYAPLLWDTEFLKYISFCSSLVSDLDLMLALHLPPFASKTPKIAPVLHASCF